MYDQAINIQTQFKERLTPVVACIKDKLHRDVGTSNAYDIIAAAQGIKDYQTAKGLAKKPFYTLRANIGSADAPMWIIENIGYLEEDNGDAQYQANLIRNRCNIALEWKLYCDDKFIDYTYTSEPTPKKGRLCVITITGDTDLEIELGLEEVKNKIAAGNEEGLAQNDSGSYEFDVFGDEVAGGEEFHIDINNDFAIIDVKSIYYACDDEDDIDAYFQEYIEQGTIEGEETELEGDTLYLCQQVTMKEVTEDRDYLESTFIAVPTIDGESAIVLGDTDELLENMDEDFSYYLYKVLRETPIEE